MISWNVASSPQICKHFLVFLLLHQLFFPPFLLDVTVPSREVTHSYGRSIRRCGYLWTLTPRSAPLTLTRPCLTSCMKGVKVIEHLKIKQPFSFVNQPGKGQHQISVIRGFEPTKPTCHILKVTLFISHDVVCSHHKCLVFFFLFRTKSPNTWTSVEIWTNLRTLEFRAHLRPAALIYGDILSSSEAN